MMVNLAESSMEFIEGVYEVSLYQLRGMPYQNYLQTEHWQHFKTETLKFSQYTKKQFQQEAVRIVPNACIRKGAYIAKNTILMPSFVNIGAYVDEGSLIDTWATVGSCAQIGKNVHLS